MTDPMARLEAALADHYRIEREVGAGGMATVYLAEDLKHRRKVALKVLKPELAAVLGAERFVAEIMTTAALQHPNILPLFDSGTADGFLFYVMPFIHGETLRARLDRETQLGVDDAVRIANDVAEALEYAHSQGVVHRDIKPENILLQDGRALVADFGIALAVSAAAGGRMTETGLSLGTPHYMSPEQATAEREITARSDVYSLGCVLYEMLTGDPPHTGSSAQQVVMKILTEDVPPVTTLRRSVPPNVAAALARAIERLPADRFHSAAKFATALNDPGFRLAYGAGAGHLGGDGQRSRWRALALGAIGLAAVSVAAGFWGWSRGAAPGPAAPPAQFMVSLPPGVDLPGPGATHSVTVSPDGATVAFLAWEGGQRRIFVRSLSDQDVRVLPGTEDAQNLFFSPDGRSIGFAAQGLIRKVDLAGGAVTTLASVGSGLDGATWGADDVILFSRGPGSGLWRVRASGGQPQQVTALDTVRGDAGHVHPHFLQGGRSFVFAIYRGAGDMPLAAGTLDGRTEELGQAGSWPQHVPASGHLLYSTAAGDLMAARFDPERRRITGPPTTVLSGLYVSAGYNTIWASSPNGTLAVDRGSTSSRLVQVDRAGRVQPLSTEARDFRMPRVSPDGQRISVQVTIGGEDGIWILDRRTGTLARFTSGPSSTDAIWTPGGDRIAFSVTGDQESVDIYWQAADGSGSPEVLVSAPGNQWPWSWTPDSRTILFDEISMGQPTRIMAVNVGRDAEPRTIVGSDQYSNRLARLSPDGRWLAHTSNETGRSEVYVRPFPGPGGKQQISPSGGDQPVWSPDGRELFYIDGHDLVAAQLTLGNAVSVTARTPLFEFNFSRSNATNYDALPDGSGFVMLEPLESTRRLTVLVNWAHDLRRRAGETAGTR
jgi:eukaryotic-like serine/threonine-protein kinase